MDKKGGVSVRKIKLIIDSNLDHVSFIGTAINKLCSLISHPDVEPYQIQLCVEEAVINSIKHAYGKEAGHEVEVVFTLYPDRLILEVCDTGRPMDQDTLKQANLSSLTVDPNNPGSIPEGGRGLGIMKEIMDTVVYKTDKGKNCLIMMKKTGN